jgi:TolB-like protein
MNVLEEVVLDPAKKKDKVRSAWISFAGRITAQIIGAIATVTLGVVVLGKPNALSTGADARPLSEDTVAQASELEHSPREVVVAVLPLDDYSAKSDHFSQAVTEALIRNFSQSGGLRVISRTSSEHFKRSQQALPQAAKDLGANYVIEGSVARVGGRVRVTAQLIEVRTDEHVWARSYERAMIDELALHDELASAIAEDVAGLLAPAPAKTAGAGSSN